MELTIHFFTFWMFVCIASKYFNVVSGQKLTLSMNDNDQTTNCTQPVTYGLRYGLPTTQDVFLFRGIVNAAGINLTAMSNSVIFQRNKGNTTYATDCIVDLYKACNTTPAGRCYCESQNNQVYNLAYRDYTAKLFLDSVVRIRWLSTGGSEALSNVMKMPPLYDINNPNDPPIELTLTVNGQKYPISGTLPGQCSFSLVAGQANTLELTPNKAARPCYLRISASSSSGSVQSASNGTDYTSITVTPANVNVTTIVEIEYSMCVPGNFPLGSCVASTNNCTCCEEICCGVSEADLVIGCVLLVIGIVLAILLCLDKIPRITIVQIYTGISIVCNAVSLIIGAISTSEHCHKNCCKCKDKDSLKDCPLGIASAVLIGVCAVDIMLGVALLTYLCCRKKKGKSDLPHGSSNTELTSKNRRPSHVAPAKHPVDNTDMPDGGNQPRHTPDSGNQPRHTPDSGNQSRHKPDGGDKPRHKPDGGDQPRHKTNEDKPRPLPTPLGSDAAISTSTTSHLPLNSNFSTIGKTLDSQANRPTSIDGTRQLPQLRNERGHKL